MEIKTFEPDTLFLRTHMAEVELESGEKIDISMNCDGGSILFHFPDAIYMVTLRAMMDRVLAYRAVKTHREEEKGGTDSGSSDSNGEG